MDIGQLKIDAACNFDRRGVTLAEEIDLPFQQITLIVQCCGSATQAQLDKLAQKVGKYCSLSKWFRQASTQIIEQWIPANPTE